MDGQRLHLANVRIQHDGHSKPSFSNDMRSRSCRSSTPPATAGPRHASFQLKICRSGLAVIAHSVAGPQLHAIRAGVQRSYRQLEPQGNHRVSSLSLRSPFTNVEFLLSALALYNPQIKSHDGRAWTFHERFVDFGVDSRNVGLLEVVRCRG